jgi:hypothetical protein
MILRVHAERLAGKRKRLGVGLGGQSSMQFTENISDQTMNLWNFSQPFLGRPVTVQPCIS